MSTPDCYEQLRNIVATLPEVQLVDMYERMVRSRNYQPIDVVGARLWRELRDHEDEDAVLRRIGAVCRGCLGIDG